MNKLYASTSLGNRIRGIQSVSINESHSSPVTIATIECVDENTNIGEEVTIYLGYTNYYKQIFRGYIKQKEYKIPNNVYSLTLQDYMCRAVDYFIAADDPKNVFKRRNISAENLVRDVFALAGLTNFQYDPTGFTLAINVDAEVNLISVYDYAKSIADIVTWSLWADEFGAIQFRNRKPYIMTGDTGQPGDDFDEREESYLPSIVLSGGNILVIERTKDETNLRNKIVVYGDKEESATASSGTSYDPETKSYVSVLPSGFYKTTVIASNLIGGKTLCQKTANYNLDKLNRLSLGLKIQIVGNPDIHARQVIRVNYPSISNNRNWYVYSVEHSWGSAGYTTSMMLRI